METIEPRKVTASLLCLLEAEANYSASRGSMVGDERRFNQAFAWRHHKMGGNAMEKPASGGTPFELTIRWVAMG